MEVHSECLFHKSLVLEAGHVSLYSWREESLSMYGREMDQCVSSSIPTSLPNGLAVWVAPLQSGNSQTEVECTCSATVYTAATLQHTQCTCSIGCPYTADTLQTAVYTGPTSTLPAGGSVCNVSHCESAVYLQPTLQIHWKYTAYTLLFGLGMFKDGWFQPDPAQTQVLTPA